jgi:hypothetical protein
MVSLKRHALIFSDPEKDMPEKGMKSKVRFPMIFSKKISSEKMIRSPRNKIVESMSRRT